MEKEVEIHPEWKSALAETFEQPYFHALRKFVRDEYARHTVFPKGTHIFRALNTTPLSEVRVVILGQDPYHGPGQANGLCFSVNKGTAIPPSLQNIFKEILANYPRVEAGDGDLEPWARQGVLLLNATLTVRAHSAGSHQNKGWEDFTDAVIETINREKKGVVYLLWGTYAQRKGARIDASKNLVLKSPHPSPLSAYRGFFGNGHFIKTNAYLRSRGSAEIKW